MTRDEFITKWAHRVVESEYMRDLDALLERTVMFVLQHEAIDTAAVQVSLRRELREMQAKVAAFHRGFELMVEMPLSEVEQILKLGWETWSAEASAAYLRELEGT